MGLVDKLRAKMELYRLEQRYSRRDKRTTFYANAEYVDGEYVFKPTGASLYSARADSAPKRASMARVTEIFPSSRTQKSY